MSGTEYQKTRYPGIYQRATKSGDVTFYSFFRRDGKQIKDKIGKRSEGWSARAAAEERAFRIKGKRQTAKERKQVKPDLDNLWSAYLNVKGVDLKGVATDKNRYEKHIKPLLGKKTPDELVPLDIERLKRKLGQGRSSTTVRHVLELLRRVINFGIKKQLCPPLTWIIEMPRISPDSERIEVLTQEQFQKLNEVWSSYPDRHIANLHKLIAWTGMRPSEPLKLEWSDIDFERKQITKRNTKSGKTILLRMNDTVQDILIQQRILLEQSPIAMRTSALVFPTESGNARKLDSYGRHFRKIRDLAGIPKEYRPNYCLRDTIASMMLSNGATLGEVGYQLGHEPGSPMTRRYAKYIPDAQKSIAEKAEKTLKQMLMIQEKTIEFPQSFTHENL